MTAPDLAVVVPTHQRRDLVLRVLAAIARQSLPPSRYQVVVVCDGCTDGSAEAVRRAAESGAPLQNLSLTVLQQPRAGAATARNQGAASSTAPLLLFLDDDMIAERELLAAHVDRHARQPGAIVLGHMPVHPESPRSYLTIGLGRWADRRHQGLSRAGAEVPMDEVLTGQMSLARRRFEELGGFDTRFTAGGSFGGEDIEFGWRARRLGIPVLYEPRAVSWQIYAKTFRALSRNIRDGGAADALLAAKHPEVRTHLPLGRIPALPRWERIALRGTLAAPRLAAPAFAPLLLLLELAARAGATSRLFEHLHAVCRSHLYGLGLLDAAGAASGSSTA